ncbi:hypothetical protein E2C01_006509 [Portunus trituberculatus]|uniref:Uncharacterized protein n=1 Tax=Portunus trituberculatus TaxID=210409 RepID=A0A5B7CXJ2_PORTR|nr:hypothetical protein [Portunus trituberculatus]
MLSPSPDRLEDPRHNVYSEAKGHCDRPIRKSAQYSILQHGISNLLLNSRRQAVNTYRYLTVQAG